MFCYLPSAWSSEDCDCAYQTFLTQTRRNHQQCAFSLSPGQLESSFKVRQKEKRKIVFVLSRSRNSAKSESKKWRKERVWMKNTFSVIFVDITLEGWKWKNKRFFSAFPTMFMCWTSHRFSPPISVLLLYPSLVSLSSVYQTHRFALSMKGE